ncbi:protocadherin Fat 4-like [Corticium candelabrum]|uniref:protocadherin Fat 4-like n=1 Tax=Corticium candelabrum TaxID=121492 RepID=UPI002E26525D|nr:protocadherin Fat 4-like [Corticium candelabrum]
MAVTRYSLFYSMVKQAAGSSWPRSVLSLFVALIILHWSNGQGQASLDGDYPVHMQATPVHGGYPVHGDYDYSIHSVYGFCSRAIVLAVHNSFPPVLLKSPCCAEVAENSSVGTLVYQINVTNRDSNDVLTYTLPGGHEYFEFRNSSNRGIITIKRQVDREILLSDIVQLKVEVSDGVHEPVTGDVCVLITDVNDNAPIPVNALYSVSLPEDSNVGRTIVNVRAKDADEGTNSHVQYRFIKGNKDGRFSISPFSGDIKLETSLDYESQPRSYVLTVQTYDLGKPSLSATAKVDINVININDNKPHFQKDVFVGNQEEGTPTHTSIVKVIATDLDSGIFGKLSYSIVGGNDDGRFYINNTTGDISNAKVLDREQQDSYNLIVEVTDGGLTKL